MKLEVEELMSNYATFKGYIEKHIDKERAPKLINMYETGYGEDMLTAPASGKAHFHNCFPGGYVDHVNRVIQFTLQVAKLWHLSGIPINCTSEELVMAAVNHDLGKLGLPGKPNYVPQTNNWRKEKLGEEYTQNPELDFMLIQDRSLYILQMNGISLSQNEYLGIKLHDGLYDDTNKPYYISRTETSGLRTYLPEILHQGDIMASRFEYQRYKLTKK